MVHIRNSFFETNSSSANVLIIPKNQGVRVPSRFIYVDDGTSSRPTELIIYKILHGWHSNNEDIDKIVNFLYLSGVEEIIYGGSSSYFENAINKYKDNPIDLGVPDGWSKEVLKLALFGTETEIEFFYDGDNNRPNYDANYNMIESDDNNYYREFYAS